jgi:hypothetical protein
MTSPAASPAPPGFLIALVPPAVFFSHCECSLASGGLLSGRLVYL